MPQSVFSALGDINAGKARDPSHRAKDKTKMVPRNRKAGFVVDVAAPSPMCGRLTFKVTGAARLHRAASRERSERGRPQGWASLVLSASPGSFAWLAE